MTNRIYVVDASVFLATLRVTETHYTEASELLKRVYANNWQIYIPTIVLPEIAASITRNRGKVTRAQRVLKFIQEQAHIAIVAVDERLGRVAADIAAQQRIRGCDAVYVALAQLRVAVLITLDEEQRQRVPSPVIARTPAEELALLNV